MKKLIASIITVFLVFVLCACEKNIPDISDGSLYSEPIYSSQVSDTSSETKETVSDNVSSDATPSATESASDNTVSSKPSATTSSNVKDTTS